MPRRNQASQGASSSRLLINRNSSTVRAPVLSRAISRGTAQSITVITLFVPRTSYRDRVRVLRVRSTNIASINEQ
jgi:hypothetical protein